MEAKRYGESLRLEDVAGKIWIASHELASDIDFGRCVQPPRWGDAVLANLEQLLEERGISLLMLDWTAAPLPRLAVLLAAARGEGRAMVHSSHLSCGPPQRMMGRLRRSKLTPPSGRLGLS